MKRSKNAPSGIENSKTHENHAKHPGSPSPAHSKPIRRDPLWLLRNREVSLFHALIIMGMLMTVGVHGTRPTSPVAGVTALWTAQKVVELHTLGQGEGSALQGRDEGKQTAGGC